MHECPLGEGSGRREIDRSGDVVPIDEERRRADEVMVVDPGQVLVAARDRPAEAEPRQPQQVVEYATAVGAHHHRRAQGHLAGARRPGPLLLPLPVLRDLDAEIPVAGDIGLAAADHSGRLVVRCVEAVGVDGGGAHLEPDLGRPPGSGDRLAHDARGVHARVHHGPEVLLGVAAADAAAGQIDHDIAAVDRVRPGAESSAVPSELTVMRRPSGEHHDLVARGGQRAVEYAAHLTGASGYHYLHGVSPLPRCTAMSDRRRRRLHRLLLRFQ